MERNADYLIILVWLVVICGFIMLMAVLLPGLVHDQQARPDCVCDCGDNLQHEGDSDDTGG